MAARCTTSSAGRRSGGRACRCGSSLRVAVVEAEHSEARGVRDGGRDRLEEVGGERRPGSVGEHEGRRRGPSGASRTAWTCSTPWWGTGRKLGLLPTAMVAVEGRAPRGALPRLEPGPSASPAPPRLPSRHDQARTRRGAPRCGAYGRPQRPPIRLQTTTLWYPAQQHGHPDGDPRLRGHAGVGHLNLLTRYTREGDLVVDPFAAAAPRWTWRGTQAAPPRLRPAAPPRRRARADARDLPLQDGEADFVFMDPPYSTHIEYSDDPRCIGKQSAFGDGGYFEAMYAALDEAVRVLPALPRGLRQRQLREEEGFAPIGIQLGAHLLGRGLRPIDHVSVVRGTASSRSPRSTGPRRRGTSSRAVSSTS